MYDKIPKVTSVLCFFCCFIIAHGLSRKECFNENIQTWRCNYIPKDIPAGFPRVRLIQFFEKNVYKHICDYAFKSANWSSIRYLELRAEGYNSGIVIKENCFIQLKSLTDLSLNIAGTKIQFEPGAFRGLHSVTGLNMSDCVRFPLEKLTEVFERKDELPNITTLSINKMYAFRGTVSLSERLCLALFPRQIKVFEALSLSLDLSNIGCYFEKLKSIEILNISASIVTKFNLQNVSSTHRLRIFDASFITPPKTFMNIPPGKIIIHNFVDDIIFKQNIQWLLSPEVTVYDGIIPREATLWFYDVKVDLHEDPKWLVKTIHFGKNNIRRADVRFNCTFGYSFSSVENVDLASNGLEFLHPSAGLCIPNVKTIDLSNNVLVKMRDENATLFEALLSFMTQLQTILLRSNGLYDLPRDMFDRNINVELIDLSSNSLEQITSQFNHLFKLNVLDLRNNRIKILDMSSIHILDSIPRTNLTDSTQIMLGSNPISCHQCGAKKFLEWLINNDLVNKSLQDGLYCVDASKGHEIISKRAYDNVVEMCLREKIILGTGISSAVILVALVAIAFFIYRHRKRVHRRQNKERIKRLVTEGEGQYEFVVMLTFSSDDEDFVRDNVEGPLNEYLGLLFPEAERGLILTGDRNFRPGFYVHEEICTSLERASVVLVVVSNNYCQSQYCREELDQAYILKKPVLLMFKENVPLETMMPTMKVLYMKYVRIIWGEENGRMFLKTTWENVCRSIMDLML